MAIYIAPALPGNRRGSWIWAGPEEEPFLRRALSRMSGGAGRYYARASPWDCLGDLLLYGVLENRRAAEISGHPLGRGIQIELADRENFQAEYYRAEDLLPFYAELKQGGWTITIRNTEDGMSSDFRMKCPSFEEFVKESEKKKGLRPVDGAVVAANAVLSGKPEKEARAYSHPVDAALVRILDNPAVNTVFKSFVDMAVDAQYGSVIASGIPVNETTFPQLDAIVTHCAETLRIRRPYVVVSGNIGFNAITMGSDEDPYIVLGNLLTASMSEDQLRFVIGHECGHVAMGHVVYHTAANVAGNLSSALPVVGPVIYNTAGFAVNAWSRRSEVTADRAGMLCCGSLELAKKTLMQIEMGFMNSDQVDVSSYVQSSQQYRKGGILRRIGEYTASHPILPKRIQALDAFAESALFYHVTNQTAPAGVMSDQALAQRVEDLIRVL